MWSGDRVSDRLFDEEYFATLLEAEERHFWFRARNRVLLGLFQQVAADLPAGYRVLEVGCGNGNVLKALADHCPGSTVVGMDAYMQGLRYARSRTSCHLVAGDARQPPFRAEFDVVGAFDVVEHVTDDVGLLCSLRDVLKPGGVLLISVPAHKSLWSYFDVASCHVRRYEWGELRHKLESAGYRVEYLTYCMAAILPLVWFLRKVRGHQRQSQDLSEDRAAAREYALREVRVVPLLNQVLEWMLSLERHVVGRRFALPLGTSLLAWARRPIR